MKQSKLFHNNFIMEKMFAAYTPFADKVNKDIRVLTLQLIGCVRLLNGPKLGITGIDYRNRLLSVVLSISNIFKTHIISNSRHRE